MNSTLNFGAGQCLCTASLSIRVSEAAAEMHATHDVLMRVLNAVHYINRNGSKDDFIAVGLPGMHMSGSRRLALPRLTDRDKSAAKQDPVSRDIVELIGSEASLQDLISCEGFLRLYAMGAVGALKIDTPLLEAGDMGIAYVRDRSTAKLGPAKLRRIQKRAAKFGNVVNLPENPPHVDHGLVALRFGDTVVRVRDIAGTVTGEPVMVSTYGFSRPDAPAFLPILPVVPATHGKIGMKDAA